jgi:hypothetical protein
MISPVRLLAAREERRRDRIDDDARRVLQVQPDDVAVVELQSRSTDSYGFEITGAFIRRGEQTIEISDQLMNELDNALYDDLSSLAWKSLVGDDKFGHAVIEVPGTPPPAPVGTWIKVNVDLLHIWLSKLNDPDDPRSTRAYTDYDITRSWGTHTQLDGGYGETLTNIIADLPEEVLFGTLGAQPVVDGLWSTDDRDPHLRVYVILDVDLRLCDVARPARHIVSGDGTGEHPEIDRLVGTIVNVVNTCNTQIDGLMNRFH